ncbi:MAG TPA: pitrilysin family protein [Gemmatimonadaceae bacterium]|nr:pitrilysin family protein [Gemmatimonadaceae bacterium]
MSLVAPPRPGASPVRPYHFPRFETHVLPNGVRVVVAPVHAHPVVTVLAIVEAGATRDPVGKHGLAVLTGRAMAEGTRTMSALELAERTESLGTVLDTGADWDSSIVQLTAMTARAPDAFAVLAEVLRQPSFPEAEMQRLVEERLSDLTQIRAEPRGLADVALNRLLYASTSRFARLAGGDERSVGSITRDDVVAFHAEHFRPDATALLVVGDCTPADALRLAEEHLGDWQGTAPVAAVPDASARFADRRVHLVDKPDAQQAEMRLGHVAVPRAHPDYFPLIVMNAILGGLFSSRLNLNLREEHGYTYGAHSAFDWRRAASPFEISSAVQTDKCADAVREALGEVERMRTTPVSEEELSLAVSYLDGVFPIRFETTAAIASGLANVEIFRLAPEYFDTYRDRVRAVTTDDVLRVARTHLDPARLQVVVVGPADVLQPALEALAIGPVSVHPPTDELFAD